MTKYEIIYESLQNQINNGLITYELAEEVNDLAYEKYVVEATAYAKRGYDKYSDTLYGKNPNGTNHLKENGRLVAAGIELKNNPVFKNSSSNSKFKKSVHARGEKNIDDGIENFKKSGKMLRNISNMPDDADKREVKKKYNKQSKTLHKGYRQITKGTLERLI